MPDLVSEMSSRPCVLWTGWAIIWRISYRTLHVEVVRVCFYFNVSARIVLAIGVFYLATAPASLAQQPALPRAPEQADDVIRIKTELVQTEIMVFDRQGRFVEGLKPEQFELRLNGT